MSAAEKTYKKYGLAALSDLCGGTPARIAETLPWHELRDDGLWLTEPPALLGECEREVWRWHPRAHSGRPALPVPFSVAELAAFMLAGGGIHLYERFAGDLDDGEHPNGKMLAAMGANAGEAREALIEAFRMRRIAIEKFGRSDDGVRQATAFLLDEMPKIKAVAEGLEAILAALRAAGIDPKNPPPYKEGTAAPHKQAAYAALKDAMAPGRLRAAWQYGLDIGAIANPMIKNGAA